jgi:hypothetical protein
LRAVTFFVVLPFTQVTDVFFPGTAATVVEVVDVARAVSDFSPAILSAAKFAARASAVYELLQVDSPYSWRIVAAS